MELKDLIGERTLSGVDYLDIKIRLYDGTESERQVVRFVIDGQAYQAEEDPDDGYRSCMRDIERVEETVKNTFPPHKVICRLVADGYHKNDVLEVIDAETQKTVLEIGTEAYDDWYPCFVFKWNPENLAINQTA